VLNHTEFSNPRVSNPTSSTQLWHYHWRPGRLAHRAIVTEVDLLTQHEQRATAIDLPPPFAFSVSNLACVPSLAGNGNNLAQVPPDYCCVLFVAGLAGAALVLRVAVIVVPQLPSSVPNVISIWSPFTFPL
jgi:hypothetical protein